MWIKIGSSGYESRQEETVESILRSFGCRASAREPYPTEGDRVEGATRSSPTDFPVAKGARSAEERQRTMRTERNIRTGTGNTAKNQGASPPAHRGRTKVGWRAAMCLLAWLGFSGVGFAQTVLWSENFDDGNGNNRWYADEGVWQVGSPTIGAPTNSCGSRTHSCPYCATTGLTANYPTTMDSRWIRIQTFTVPAANQWPRLQFWHWCSFYSGYYGNDYGVVEIRLGTTGTWTPVSPQYTAFSTDWTCASVDLSAFAGRTVQLAFHSVSPAAQTGPGWYVDDISVITGAPFFNNPEGFETGTNVHGWYGNKYVCPCPSTNVAFESGADGWYADNGTWEVGTPTKSGGPPTDSFGAQAHSGANCAVTLLSANYPTDMNSRFLSPYFILPQGSPYRHLWQCYSFYSGYYGNDYGEVEIRVGTNAWQVLAQYTGSSGNWTEPFIDLTSFGGQTVQLAFYAVSPAAQTGPGWYVDDIQVYPYILSAATPYMKTSRSKTNIIMAWTWLTNYTGLILQSTTNLVSTNWSTVSPAPVVVSRS